MSVTLEDIEQDAAAAPGRLLEVSRDRVPPIDVSRTRLVVERLSGRAVGVTRRRLARLVSAVALNEGALELYRAPPKVDRNEPCPCGSGKKYEKCRGA